MQSGRERLRSWIERSKMNQQEAAGLLSMHPVMLSQILNGVRKPGLETALTIEQVTGISVESWVLSPLSRTRSADPDKADKVKVAKR